MYKNIYIINKKNKIFISTKALFFILCKKSYHQKNL